MKAHKIGNLKMCTLHFYIVIKESLFIIIWDKQNPFPKEPLFITIWDMKNPFPKESLNYN